MLYLSYLLRICQLTCFYLYFTHGYWFNSNIFPHSQYGRRIQQRQVDVPFDAPSVITSLLGTGIVNPPTSSTPAPPPTTKTSATTSSGPDPSPTTIIATTPTPAPAPTSKANPNSPQTSVHHTVTSASTSSARTATAEPSTSTTVELITSMVTVSGSVMTSISYSTEVATVPSEPTSISSPDNSGNNSSSAGLSTKTKNTIIGVVVGVGGTAALAGLFFIVWRAWGRKKNADYDNGFTDFGTGGTTYEKTTGSGNNRPVNPFQSTLENYHNPARVNASSNF